jgi:hypothetical protein
MTLLLNSHLVGRGAPYLSGSNVSELLPSQASNFEKNTVHSSMSIYSWFSQTIIAWSGSTGIQILTRRTTPSRAKDAELLTQSKMSHRTTTSKVPIAYWTSSCIRMWTSISPIYLAFALTSSLTTKQIGTLFKDTTATFSPGQSLSSFCGHSRTGLSYPGTGLHPNVYCWKMWPWGGYSARRCRSN